MKIQIQLTDDILKQLDSLSNEMDMGRDELILNALKKYLLLNEVHKLRDQLSRKLDRTQFGSEEDLLDAIS